MSGLPRTGLFSRNHVANLTQRNRSLQQNENDTETRKDVNVEEDKVVASHGMNNENLLDNQSELNSSFASLPRDQEGFDDLDAFFNRANTPQKTPKGSKNKGGLTDLASQPGSQYATPSSHRKGGANVLVAKPVKMISSKIAEHYKREPRLAVSMSEVMSELVDNEDNLNEHEHEHEHEVEEAEEDRILRAKRELEEMSIGNSFDTEEDPIEHEHLDDENDHVRDHVEDDNESYKNQEYTKTSLHQSITMEMMPVIDDDVLMDRLVEEMLVNDNDNDNDTGAGVAVNEAHNYEEQSTQGTQTVSAATATTATTATTTTTATKKPRKPRNTGAGLTRRPMTYYAGTETTEDGLRRSCRMKMEPLRYWANEKVCYGRAEDPSITLPVIVNVIKKPELVDPTFMMGLTRKRRRPDGNVTKLRAQAFGPDCDVEAEVNCYERPGDEEVRLLALSHHHVQGDEVKDSSFRIHTIFTEGTYMSSGQLIFPPLSQKPTKNSSRHALVFYVISGSFRVEINRVSFMIGPGGQFHVPRANPYTITHVSEDKNLEGRLFFCHCKDNSE